MMNKMYSEKSDQIVEILNELDVDLWMVWVRETSQMADPVLELILGGDLVWQSALLFSRDGSKIAVVGNLDADGVEKRRIFDKIVPYTKSIKQSFLEELQKLEPKKIAINYSRNDVSADGLTVGMHMLLREYLSGTPYIRRLDSAEEIIKRLRGRKTSEEVRRIRKAVSITEDIFSQAQNFVEIGMSELEIYKFFHEQMTRLNVETAWNIDHNPAVDAGPNKLFGHSGPTGNLTKSGHLLHFDFGVKYDGYCSDIQRMFFFGPRDSVPDEIQQAFEAVRGAIEQAASFIKPGVKGYEVDAVARNYVMDLGYDEYQHALGHQVGRFAHDGGTLLGPLWERYGNSPNGIVEAGNVFTLELYVTTKDFGQVSLEEDILVTSDGCEFLSTPQTDLICIS